MQRNAGRLVLRQCRCVKDSVHIVRRHQTAVARLSTAQEATVEDVVLPFLKPRGPASSLASTSAATLDHVAPQRNASLSKDEAVDELKSTLDSLRQLHKRHPDKSPLELIAYYTSNKRDHRKPVFPPSVLDLKDHARLGTDWLTVILLQAVILGGSVLGLWTRRGKYPADGLASSSRQDSSEIEALNLLLASYAFEDLADTEAAVQSVDAFSKLLRHCSVSTSTPTSTSAPRNAFPVLATLAFVGRLATLPKPVDSLIQQARTTLTAIAWQLYQDCEQTVELDRGFLVTVNHLPPVDRQASSGLTIFAMLDELFARRSSTILLAQAAIVHRNVGIVFGMLEHESLVMSAQQRLQLSSAAIVSLSVDAQYRQRGDVIEPLARHLAKALEATLADDTQKRDRTVESAILDGLSTLMSGFAIDRSLGALIEDVTRGVLKAGSRTSSRLKSALSRLATKYLVETRSFKRACRVFETTLLCLPEHMAFYAPLLSAGHAATSDLAMRRLRSSSTLQIDEGVLYRRLSSHVATRRIDFGLDEARSLIAEFGLERTKRVDDKMLQLAVLSGSDRRATNEWKGQLRRGVVADPATYSILLNRLNTPDPTVHRLAHRVLPGAGAGSRRESRPVAALSSINARPTRKRILRAVSSDPTRLTAREREETARFARSVVGKNEANLTVEESIEVVESSLKSRVANVVHLKAMLARWPITRDVILRLSKDLLEVDLGTRPTSEQVTVKERQVDQGEWREWRAATYALLIRAANGIGELDLSQKLIAERSQEKRMLWEQAHAHDAAE